METPSFIAEALAALNEVFNVTTVALDVRADEAGFAARLDPKIGVAVLGLINAVLAERDAAESAAIRKVIDTACSSTDRLKAGRAAPTPEDILTGDPHTPSDDCDILDDIERSIGRIIKRVRAQRKGNAPTAAYYASVARLCGLVEHFDGLNEALTPTAFKDAF